MTVSIPTLATFEITLFPSGVAEIALNRPARYNALNSQSYKDWNTVFKWAAETDEVKVVVLTGRGKYYSSGQEIALPAEGQEEPDDIHKKVAITKSAVNEMINFNKVLIAGVNGPALGFGVTTLALCDVVYSVPHATFNTPFMKWGFCAEGCSSYTFPRIMGASRANEMLLMGRTFSAQELADCGFVSRILPEEGFREQVLAIAEETAKFSPAALAVTKNLIRGAERQELIKANENEMSMLIGRVTSQDSLDAIAGFVEQAKRRKAAKQAAKQASRI